MTNLLVFKKPLMSSFMTGESRDVLLLPQSSIFPIHASYLIHYLFSFVMTLFIFRCGLHATWGFWNNRNCSSNSIWFLIFVKEKLTFLHLALCPRWLLSKRLGFDKFRRRIVVHSVALLLIMFVQFVWFWFQTNK